ncbi:60S ribosomal protein L31-like [Phodopus roborovskii]|uniref:60S ribosomal protein L31-like n=1 Tax=Phodopus roborovskii TaxID=109678 RepID=UPI0021E4C878|nr:60S ribosomal protein L31-like [Phodopus roborovskii]
MVPTKQGGEKKKSCSASNYMMIRKYTINIHKCIHRMGFKKRAPQEFKETRICHEGDGASRCVGINIRLNKDICIKGIRNAPYHIHYVCPEKRNEDEGSSNKLYTLVTYIPVTTFKNLQTVNIDEN